MAFFYTNLRTAVEKNELNPPSTNSAQRTLSAFLFDPDQETKRKEQRQTTQANNPSDTTQKLTSANKPIQDIWETVCAENHG